MHTTIHTISLFVANKPGVLLRITLMFARRGYNIESLIVSSALDGRFSRMTITASGDPNTLDQIIRQANKLVDVVSASEHNAEDAVESEMALIKVGITPENRTDILQVVEHYKADTLDLTSNYLIIQATGTHEKINNMVDMLSEYKVLEVVRSGKMAIARGADAT
ncbi:MAG: acetolactate synthase small subunit [bacterium]|nr:acetolactate synthase small subunit [bacterium]